MVSGVPFKNSHILKKDFMKYLLLALILVGCTDTAPAEVQTPPVQEEQHAVTPTQEATPEPESTPEPRFEEVEVFHLETSGDRNVRTTCGSAKESNCGVEFTDCENGKIYSCLTNVVYSSEIVKKEVK
jgi:hypothetical protein